MSRELMTFSNQGIENKAPKPHRDSGFLAGLGCTRSELHILVPVLDRAWGPGTCSQHLAQQGPLHPLWNPGQPHRGKPLGTGKGVEHNMTREKQEATTGTGQGIANSQSGAGWVWEHICSDKRFAKQPLGRKQGTGFIESRGEGWK